LDGKADLAVRTIDVKLVPLKLSISTTLLIYGVAPLDSADSYRGSVVFGNVLIVVLKNILMTRTSNYKSA
jgi:hypothetical protein